ncbi:MAG: hypothetical protein RL346_2084 [Verrucomicrobiota bacterium]|jgi:hypothetical protein
MKTFLAVISVILLAIIGYFVYALDQWLGIAAFTLNYLLFCAIAAMAYGAAWYPVLRERTLIVGLAVFTILSANLLLPPPSERILRSVLLQIPPVTPSGSVEGIVSEAYDGSGYALPQIDRDDNRIHVSLLSQRSGNCTSLIFRTRDGVVVSGEYIAD